MHSLYPCGAFNKVLIWLLLRFIQMGDTAVPGWRGLLPDVGRMDAAVEPDRMY